MCSQGRRSRAADASRRCSSRVVGLSSPITMPARPRPTSVTRRRKPSRHVADAPDSPWSKVDDDDPVVGPAERRSPSTKRVLTLAALRCSRSLASSTTGGRTGTRHARGGATAPCKISFMSPPLRGPHRHRGKEVNDGSLMFIGGRRRGRSTSGRRMVSAAARVWPEGAPPAIPTGLVEETAPGRPSPPRGSLALPRARCSQRLIPLGDSDGLRPIFSTAAPALIPRSFFPASARSIVLGVDLDGELLSDRRCQLARRMGSPTTRRFSTNARISPWSLCSPRGPRFLGVPALRLPLSSKLAFAW